VLFGTFALCIFYNNRAKTDQASTASSMHARSSSQEGRFLSHCKSAEIFSLLRIGTHTHFRLIIITSPSSVRKQFKAAFTRSMVRRMALLTEHRKAIASHIKTDPQTGVVPRKNSIPQYAFEMSTIKVSAIQARSHSLLCSSSIHEPSDPPHRIVQFYSTQSRVSYGLVKVFLKDG
jgi:hypothetical protein